MKTKLLVVAAAAALLGALSAGTPAMATSIQVFGTTAKSGNQPNGDQPLDVGMDFNVLSPVTVTALGAFTNGGGPVSVGLFTTNTGMQLSSTTVPSSSVGAGPYGYVFNLLIAPITLAAGSYQIDAYYGSTSTKDYNPYEGGAGGTITFNSDGNSLAFPTSPSPDYYTLGGSSLAFATTQDNLSTAGYGAGSFEVSATPLPTTWVMLLGGLLSLGFLAYRAKRDSSVAAA